MKACRSGQKCMDLFFPRTSKSHIFINPKNSNKNVLYLKYFILQKKTYRRVYEIAINWVRKWREFRFISWEYISNAHIVPESSYIPAIESSVTRLDWDGAFCIQFLFHTHTRLSVCLSVVYTLLPRFVSLHPLTCRRLSKTALWVLVFCFRTFAVWATPICMHLPRSLNPFFELCVCCGFIPANLLNISLDTE